MAVNGATDPINPPNPFFHFVHFQQKSEKSQNLLKSHSYSLFLQHFDLVLVIFYCNKNGFDIQTQKYTFY